MADRWMDERDRRFRERDWRRADDYGRGGQEARRHEDRTWPADLEDQDYRERHGGAYEVDDGEDRGAYDVTSGGAYGQDPTGARGRYAAPPPRFGRQDYTGRGGYAERRDYEFSPRPGPADYPHRDLHREAEGRYGRHHGPADYGPRGDYDRDGPGDFLSRAGERISSWFRGSDLMQGSQHDGAPRRYREDFGRESRPIPDPAHRGRGPKGYKRADERINDEVHDRLTYDPWLDASNVEVAVKDGEVTLSGSVDNREAKHRAERLIEDIPGVVHVQNNLRANPDSALTGAGRGYGSSALEAEMRRNAWETDPGNEGASGMSGRTSTGAAAERSRGGKIGDA